MPISPPNVRVLMDRHELQDIQASDFQMTLLSCGRRSWGVLKLRELLTGKGSTRIRHHNPSNILLNNVNDQILDLYPAHNILSALQSRFVFAGFHSNPTADFWRFILV
jgi:hypothetical protein